eukprot:520161_1
MEDSKNEMYDDVGNDDQILLTMDTKLGNSKKEFLVNDLKTITYFQNQLSDRWNNGNIINISSTDLNFSVMEIEALIFYKKYHAINAKYPHDRLPYFCHTLDYFTEKLHQKVFIQYFSTCVPAIQYQKLTTFLNSVRDIKECNILSAAIQQYMKHIIENKKKYDQKILNNWETVSSRFLICNGNVAASLFITHFKCYFGFQLEEFIRNRSCTDLMKVWSFIVSKRLYIQYPQILKTIYALKYNLMYMKDMILSKNVVKMFTNIALDTIEIVLINKKLCNNNNKKGLCAMIKNFCEIINKRQNKEVILYEFVKAISLKLIKLEKDNINTFDTISAVFKVTTWWFGSCTKIEENWIISEIPKHFSIKVMDSLFEGICDYVVSKKYESNPCLPIYIDFVKKYTTIEWNLE